MFSEPKSQLPKYHLSVDKSNCKQNRRNPVIVNPTNDGDSSITNAGSEREHFRTLYLTNECFNHFLYSSISKK